MKLEWDINRKKTEQDFMDKGCMLPVLELFVRNLKHGISNRVQKNTPCHNSTRAAFIDEDIESYLRKLSKLCFGYEKFWKKFISWVILANMDVPKTAIEERPNRRGTASLRTNIVAHRILLVKDTAEDNAVIKELPENKGYLTNKWYWLHARLKEFRAETEYLFNLS